MSKRRRSGIAVLVMLAAACFLVVVTVHVFERLHVLPWFGWGQPSSVGHYIDLVAAILGIALTGGALALLTIRRPVRQ